MHTLCYSILNKSRPIPINDTLGKKDDFLSILQHNIETVLSRGGDKTLADIDKRLEKLQTELLKLVASKSDYEDVADEISRLREEKQKAQFESAGRDETRKRIADMKAFLRKQDTATTAFDEALVRRLIEKVTVYENKFTVEFKSGIMVEFMNNPDATCTNRKTEIGL
jgi:site-specific DNA recombinase